MKEEASTQSMKEEAVPDRAAVVNQAAVVDRVAVADQAAPLVGQATTVD